MSCKSALKINMEMFVIRKTDPGDSNSTLTVETACGQPVALLDGPNQINSTKTPTKSITTKTVTTSPHRIIRDASDGNVLAMISHVITDGKNHYKIFGLRPMYPGQRRNRTTGLYSYADIENNGSWLSGAKFVMTLPELSITYTASFFGPSVFKWGKGEPRGYDIFEGSQTQTRVSKAVMSRNKQYPPMAKIAKNILLGSGENNATAVIVSKDHNAVLMVCFAAIISEMVEKRMR
jgi:hypothetical protein